MKTPAAAIGAAVGLALGVGILLGAALTEALANGAVAVLRWQPRRWDQR